MSGGQNDTGFQTFTTADTTLSTRYLRCKLSGERTITLAGLSDLNDIGVIRAAAPAASTPVTVLTWKKPGSFPMVAAAAISANALVYRAASGKISATPSGAPIGRALEAATANNDVIEVLPLECRPAAAIVADPGTGQAIPVGEGDFDVMLTIGSAGAETNTLAAPNYVGQRARFFVDTVGSGTRAITSAGQINVATNTIMTFAEVRDYIELVGVTVAGALKWQVLANANVSLS